MRRLRLQLTGVLLLVALLPALPAALTVHALFQRSFESRLDPLVEESARAGLASTRELLNARKDAFPQRLAGGSLDTLTAARVGALPPRERDTLRALAPGAEPQRVALMDGEALVVRLPGGDWAVDPLPAEWVDRARTLAESARLVETLQRERNPVVRSLVLTFLVVYGAILVLVLVLGLSFASRLTRPLDDLAAGIERVAARDWSTKVPEPKPGSLRPLTARFNQMVGRLRSQEEELVRLERQAAWRNLARRLAHEIKNPLTPIQLAAEQLQDAYPGEDPGYRALLAEGTAIIREEVASLRELVREFSQFARLPEPALRPTELDDVLAAAAGLYGREKLRVPGALPVRRVRCDPDEIHRVLINLVNNALHAQQETGQTVPVELHVEPPRDGLVEIRVLDRGPGVPADQRERVFDPDFSTRNEGMGLGLAIVLGIVRAHGGTIRVEDRDGGGAAFAFTLPIEPPEKEPS